MCTISTELKPKTYKDEDLFKVQWSDGTIFEYHKDFITPLGYGLTPAHEYVMTNKLPLEFLHWGLKDKEYRSIAYFAIYNDNLPDGFAKRWPRLWKNKNRNGISIEWLSKNLIQLPDTVSTNNLIIHT